MKKKFGPTQIAIIALALLMVAAIVVTIVSVVNKKDDQQVSTNETNATDSNTGSNTEADTDSNNTSTTGGEQQKQDQPTETRFINLLTGLETTEAISKQRPVAMTINNINVACPQEGIAKADLIYECNAEGGITRLLCFFQDYSNLGQTGSVRSAREYFLDFAQNHDALLFHAGGADSAYAQIKERNIDNFDGVKMGFLGGCYYRDTWRKNNMGMEHSLMIKGEGIVSAIEKKTAYYGKTIRTNLKDDFESPFNFVEYDKAADLQGDEAKCVYLPFSYYQKPYLKYDSTTNKYKRWQYNEPHIDKTTGEQLEFTNIIVLLCYQSGALDNKGHIEVDSTGTGEGYYITGGKKVEITYSKANGDTPMKLFNKDGSPLEINRGKTYIAVMSKTTKDQIQFNYNK